MALIKLRKIDMPGGSGEFRVRTTDGGHAWITARPLSARGENLIQWALIQIKNRYQPDVFGVPLNAVLGAAKVGVFLQADAPEVGAYSANMDDDRKTPVYIFNRALLHSSTAKEKREFVVTLLHELMHAMHKESADRDSEGTFEASFDLACYKALGFDVPASHWAWKRLGIDVEKLLKEQEPEEKK